MFTLSKQAVQKSRLLNPDWVHHVSITAREKGCFRGSCKYKERQFVKLKQFKIKQAQKLKILRNSPEDPVFVRIRYVRYLDKFLIGIIGSKQFAVQTLAYITNLLKSNLQFKAISIVLVHGRSNKIRFLNFDISLPSLGEIKRTSSFKKITGFSRIRNRLLMKQADLKSKERKIVDKSAINLVQTLQKETLCLGASFIRKSQNKEVPYIAPWSHIKLLELALLKLKEKFRGVKESIKKSTLVTADSVTFCAFKKIWLDSIRSSLASNWISLGTYNLYGRELLDLRNKFLSALNNSVGVPTIQKSRKCENFNYLKCKSEKFKQKKYVRFDLFSNPRIKAPLVDLIIKKMREWGMLKKNINAPTSVLKKVNLPVYQIILWFEHKCLFFLYYYRCVYNLGEVKKQLSYQMRYSLLMTLATKHRSSVTQVIKKYGEYPTIYIVSCIGQTFCQLRKIVMYPTRGFIYNMSKKYLGSVSTFDFETLDYFSKPLNFFEIFWDFCCVQGCTVKRGLIFCHRTRFMKCLVDFNSSRLFSTKIKNYQVCLTTSNSLDLILNRKILPLCLKHCIALEKGLFDLDVLDKKYINKSIKIMNKEDYIKLNLIF